MSDRLLDAALALTAEVGWARVTMAALAARAGVSRQTLYNAWGSRTRLAEAMVRRELGSFLAAIEAGFDAHPAAPDAGVAEAIRRVQRLARDHVLLRTIVAAGPGEAGELVPLLTTRADAVLAAATGTVRRRLTAWPSATDAERDATADLLVRTVLSHLLQPGPDPECLPDRLARVVSRLLGGQWSSTSWSKKTEPPFPIRSRRPGS